MTITLESENVKRAIATYNTMIVADETSVLAWRNVASQLWAASHELTGDCQTFVRDRSNDAHQRADHARRTAAAIPTGSEARP
jgi:hypothetical protein